MEGGMVPGVESVGGTCHPIAYLPGCPPMTPPTNPTTLPPTAHMHCTAHHALCCADNPALYQHLVERLAHVLELRAQSDPQVGKGGCSGCSVGCVQCGAVWWGGAERPTGGWVQ